MSLDDVRSPSTTLSPESSLPGVLEILGAYLAAQPRGVRIFTRRLEILWDNTPNREEVYPLFRNGDGQPVPIPVEGLQRKIWPVHQVRNGALRAERLYKLEPPVVVEIQCYRATAWPLAHPATRERLIIEETERLSPKDCQDRRIGQLDMEVEHLLGQIVEYLEEGRAGDVLRLRLANPHVRKCRQVRECDSVDCPAFKDQDGLRCWEVPNTFCPDRPQPQDLLTKFRYCHKCEVFVAACPDPLTRVAENFNRLISLLQLKYQEALEAQRHLQQTEKLDMMGELLAGIAHEIKNPLGIIMGRLDVLTLEMENLTAEEVAEDFEVIRTQAQRVKAIIDHLLKMARPAPLDAKPASINEIIVETLPMVRKTLQNAGVQLLTRLVGRLPLVEVDSVHIQQVLINLILNARDAMPNGGTLTIATEPEFADPAGVFVYVQDTGIGMTPEQLRGLFSPFYTTKVDQGGTGLGLAVCQRILRQHSGRIQADSQVNQGTTMRIWLPVKGAGE